MTRPSVIDALPDVECPPPLTTKGMAWMRTCERTAVMSEGMVGLTTQACMRIRFLCVLVG
jgi:hypothetical protein